MSSHPMIRAFNTTRGRQQSQGIFVFQGKITKNKQPFQGLPDQRDDANEEESNLLLTNRLHKTEWQRNCSRKGTCTYAPETTGEQQEDREEPI